MADTSGLGYLGAASVFGGALALLALTYYTTKLSRVFLFWAAFILARPLGTVGDFFDKPLSHGGLHVSRPIATAIIAAVMLPLIFLISAKGRGGILAVKKWHREAADKRFGLLASP